MRSGNVAPSGVDGSVGLALQVDQARIRRAIMGLTRVW
jgi:hypothetical protein